MRSETNKVLFLVDFFETDFRDRDWCRKVKCGQNYVIPRVVIEWCSNLPTRFMVTFPKINRLLRSPYPWRADLKCSFLRKICNYCGARIQGGRASRSVSHWSNYFGRLTLISRSIPIVAKPRSQGRACGPGDIVLTGKELSIRTFLPAVWCSGQFYLTKIQGFLST